MLLIPCPYCGTRDEREFVYGGDATASPILGAEAAIGDAEWSAALYLRDDPRGQAAEHWVHRHGCRRWLEITRDRTTHAIVSVVPASLAPARR